VIVVVIVKRWRKTMGEVIEVERKLVKRSSV